MIRRIESILISSENARSLAGFYKDKVGLKQTAEMEMGDKDEIGFAFEMEGCDLFVMDHSDVKGSSNQPSRIMFNLEVDDIEKEVKKLKDHGVKLIQDIYHVEEYGQIATFEDIDGNYFQFVQIRPS